MFRVFLIDDEPWVLKGLERLLDWEQLGFQIVCSSSNSRIAWDQICAEVPDVVFSDIRMPGLSGLELLRRIREANLPIEVVLLSGFAEFTYAQEAVQQGAFQYLLKPADRTQLTECLTKLSLKLEQKRKALQKAEMNRRRQLILEGESLEEVLSTLNGNRELPGSLYVVFSVCGEEPGGFEQALGDETFCAAIGLEAGEVIAIAASAWDADKLFKHCLSNAQHAESLVFGMMIQPESLVNMKSLLWYARAARATAEFIGCAGLVYPYGNPGFSKEQEMLKAIRYQEPQLLKNALQSLEGEVQEGKLTVDQLFLLLRTINGATNSTKNSKLYSSQWMQYTDMLRDVPSVQQFFARLKICLGLQEDRGWLSRILDEVQNHYANAKTLATWSEELSMSQAALSQQIRRLTGSTYSELLQAKRMEKSCELLKYSSCSMAEIAELIGYSDQFYFSKIFKKVYGVSPNAFRRRERGSK